MFVLVLLYSTTAYLDFLLINHHVPHITMVCIFSHPIICPVFLSQAVQAREGQLF